MIDLEEFDPTGTPVDEVHEGREYRRVKPAQCHFCTAVAVWFVVEKDSMFPPNQDFLWVCADHKFKAFS